jgi:nucleoside-diphosphate-sugar epimerase
MKICVSGAAGFIGGYMIEELLAHGHAVVGLDNFSKYGEIARGYLSHPSYRFVRGDAKEKELLKNLLEDCDIMVAAAARIGGISYFHQFAYDLLAENERIVAATFDGALWAYQRRQLKRIVVLSSSMVYESTTIFPTPEGAELTSPPPHSSYGFQKLACEYFARAAWEQYRLPFTIVRPFNCVGIGEGRAISAQPVVSGNIKLAMSHVLPDLVLKILRRQDPLHILGSGRQLRHFTYGGDVARGIRLAIESDRAVNQDFNISTAKPTTILELAELIWKKLNPDKPFRHISDPPYPHDVQMRVPEVSKARKVLGFEATTSLDQVLDEVIPWIDNQIRQRRM